MSRDSDLENVGHSLFDSEQNRNSELLYKLNFLHSTSWINYMRNNGPRVEIYGFPKFGQKFVK